MTPTTVRAKRITSGSYRPDEQAIVAGHRFEPAEPPPPPLPQGPSPEEIDRLITLEVEKARKSAWDEGFRAGMVEGRKSIDAEKALLRNLMESIPESVDTVWNRIEREVGYLALEIGRKVIGEAANAHEEVALGLAKRAIELAREQTNVTIYVSEADVEMLKSSEIALLQLGEGIRSIEILPRANIKPGGVILECEVGKFDLRPEIQIEALESALQIDAVEIVAEEE